VVTEEPEIKEKVEDPIEREVVEDEDEGFVLQRYNDIGSEEKTTLTKVAIKKLNFRLLDTKQEDSNATKDLDEHLLGPGLEEKVIIDKPQPVDQAWDEEALNLSDTEEPETVK